MHAGQIDYNTQQPIVEEVAKRSPEFFLRFSNTASITKNAQEKKKILVGVTYAAHCHVKRNQRDYVSDKGMPQAADDLIECLRQPRKPLRLKPEAVADLKRAFEIAGYIFEPETGKLWDTRPTGASEDEQECKTPPCPSRLPPNLKRTGDGGYVVTGAGMGPKTRNMAGEYFGCDTAVAVDRHVANWLANRAGRLAWYQTVLLPKFDKNGRRIGMQRKNAVVTFTTSEAESRRMRARGFAATSSLSYGVMATMKRALLQMGHECGVPPAELQVAAWADGVCSSGVESLFLGDGAHASCENVPRYRIPLSEWAAPVVERDPKPSPRFRCGADFLGGSRKGGQLGAPGKLIPILHKIDGPFEQVGPIRPMRIVPRAQLVVPPRLPLITRRPPSVRPPSARPYRPKLPLEIRVAGSRRR
jgi:hypothetical protein